MPDKHIQWRDLKEKNLFKFNLCNSSKSSYQKYSSKKCTENYIILFTF
jgi:hypothetical protein